MSLNIKKIDTALSNIASLLLEDALNEEEYLVLCANMLIGFAKSNISSGNLYPDLDLNNANQIELTFAQEPEDINLACLLQGHAIIYGSRNLGDSA